MKRNSLWISIGFSLFGAVLGCASFPAVARNERNGGYVLVNGEGEKVCCAYMGLYMDDLTHRMRNKLGYPHETGVLITKIEPASPAEKAGLAQDDIVYIFNGTKVEESAQLSSLVRAQEPGDKASLVIYRNGAEKKIAVTLGARKFPPIITDDFGAYGQAMSKAMQDVNESAMKIYRKSFMTRGRLGMAFHDLNEDLAEYFSVRKGEGVLVLDVEIESPAAKTGIKPGDVIVGVNGTAVSDAGDLLDALSEAADGDKVSLDVMRKGTKQTVEIEIAKGFGTYNFYIAPFERSKGKKESLDRYLSRRGSGEAAKLREEMKALQERLKELEDRLDKAERKE